MAATAIASPNPGCWVPQKELTRQLGTTPKQLREDYTRAKDATLSF